MQRPLLLVVVENNENDSNENLGNHVFTIPEME